MSYVARVTPGKTKLQFKFALNCELNWDELDELNREIIRRLQVLGENAVREREQAIEVDNCHPKSIARRMISRSG